jgi:hypothetical protein
MSAWHEEDGNYLQHFRVRNGPDGISVIESVIELRDGREFRLNQDSARSFVQFALHNPDLEAQAAKLQELSLPELQGTSTYLSLHATNQGHS